MNNADTPSVTTVVKDRRIRRTEAQLAKALGELLQSKALDDITVTELTAEADINRATFYAHYSSVRELFGQIAADQCAALRILIKRHANELAHNNPRALIHDLFTYTTTNKELLALLGHSDDGSLYNDILDTVQESLITYMVPLKNASGHFLDITDNTQLTVFHYQTNFIAGGLINLIRCWFTTGRKESTEIMITMANAYVAALDERSYLNAVATVEALPGNDH